MTEKDLYHVKGAAGEFVGIRPDKATWQWPEYVVLEKAVGISFRPGKSGQLEMSITDLSRLYEKGRIILSGCTFKGALTKDSPLRDAYNKATSNIIQPEISKKSLPPELQNAMKVG